MNNTQRFYSWLLCVIFIVLSAVDVYSQTLSIKTFEAATLDLTARTKPVKDANRKDCALLKIVSPDAITKVEGNIIKEVDNANEYWVYLSEGTKSVRIFTSHHSPLTLNFPQYIDGGVSSQSTYLLELQSDLPVEVLFGTANSFSPVKISGAGGESRPVWWNTDEAGLYVGVSSPTYDGESAKLLAITNAVNLYAQSIGAEVEYVAMVEREYVAMVERENESTDYQQSYRLFLRDFDLRILQEYYSPAGEYFVLCRFSQMKNDTNVFESTWTFIDNEYSGNLIYNSRFICKINRGDVSCDLNYTCDWNQDRVNFTAYINDNQILEKEHDLSASHDNLTDMRLSGGIGFNQLRLISSLPCLPDSISIIDNTSYTKNDNAEEFRSICKITGAGTSVPREYKINDCNDDVCTFSLPEKFPTHKLSESQIPIEELDKMGLSRKYFHDYGTYGEGSAYKFISLEHNKNVAFLNSICSLLMQAQRSNVLTEDKPSKVMIKVTEKSCSGAIFPLWYLDSAERTGYHNKKHKSEWERYQNCWELQVRTFPPLAK